MERSGNILVLAEMVENGKAASISIELLGLGRTLADGLGTGLSAVIMGDEASEAGGELARHGAEEVLCLHHPRLKAYHPELYQQAMLGMLRSSPPRVLLAGHTALGQDLLPRLAFSLSCGLVTDCVGARVEGGEVLFTRPVYGGNALATQRVTTAMAMATVRARVGEAPPPSEKAGEVRTLGVDLPDPVRLEVTGRETLEYRECPLEEAPVVVSGGRGMGGEEGFSQLRELASLLGGAVGASRPPVDAGWAPTTCQVGITGKVVAPDLYIAVAISGSTQHLSGMSEAGKIVAINKDPDAYIFKVSDYGVVGDWKQVLPSFTAALREMLKE
ncbi:MAG: electron transfer flavoprotein subunit alpha/FixB family protein [Actinomycetota bacterium]|nr:electron transfer flavoprotein subunit alpha/FixB family protein [Actinomycetota bacterium]